MGKEVCVGAGHSGQCGHGVRVTQRVSPAPGKKTESNRGFICVKSAKSYCKYQVTMVEEEKDERNSGRWLSSTHS